MDFCFSSLKTRSQLSLKTPVSSPVTEGDVTIRAARLRDLHPLAGVLAQSFHPPVGWMFWVHPFLRLGIYEDLRSRFSADAPHYLCLTAIAPPTPSSTPSDAPSEKEIAGTVELGLRSPYTEQTAIQYPYISNLAVSQTHRRQGIGRQLLLCCEQQVRVWGFQDIYLHVLENNQQARSLYRSLNYKVERVEANCATVLLQRPRKLFLHKQLC